MTNAPSITIRLIDPGDVASSPSNGQVPIYIGVAAAGPLYSVREFSNRDACVSVFDKGHLVDVVSQALACGAKTVKCMRIEDTVVGTAESTDTDATLVLNTITGDALHFLEGRVEVVAGGSGAISTGTRKVRYTLDNWDIPFVDSTWSAPVTVAADGTFSLAGTGLVVDLETTQDPAVGDYLEFRVTPAHYSATEVALCEPALKHPLAGDYTFPVYTGDAETASAANTIAQAVYAQISSMFEAARFIAAMTGGSLDADTDVITAFAASFADPPFLSVGYGAAYMTAPVAAQGRGRYALREHEVAAMHASSQLISTDLGRTASKALKRVVGTDYDAALQGNAMHDARLSVLRNWEPSSKGLFIQRQRLLSNVNSNFVSWPHAAVMLEALRATHRVGFQLVLDTLRRTGAGKIDPRDASDIESAVNKEFKTVLLEPTNARGTPGHASAASAVVDQSVNLPALKIDIKIRPVDYATDLEFSLQYSDAV